ncbi:phosphoglycerate kinase, partial [Biomphalaria glabrata]
YQIVDIGPFTRNCYQNVLTGAKTMVWCGLMGDLPDGTAVISKAFALATRHGVSTYITDEQTRDAFDSCGQKDVTHITL